MAAITAATPDDDMVYYTVFDLNNSLLLAFVMAKAAVRDTFHAICSSCIFVQNVTPFAFLRAPRLTLKERLAMRV